MTDQELWQAVLASDTAFIHANRNDPLMEDALRKAAYHNRLDVLAFLLDRGFDIDVQPEPGRYTPLIGAASNSSVEAIRFLLEHGANPYMRTADGSTAIEKSEERWRRREEAIATFREFGVEPSLAYLAEHDPVGLRQRVDEPDFSILDSRGRSLLPSLILARQGDLSMELLNKHGGVDLAGNKEGLTVLHAAILRKSAKLVREILSRGANPNPIGGDFFDETPLILAVSTRAYALLPILLESGADPNLADIYGRTPIIHAVRTGSTKPVEILLSAGANPRLGRNLSGQDEGPDKGDAYVTARQEGKRPIIKLLETWTPPTP